MQHSIEALQQRSQEVADFLKTIAHPDRLVAMCLLSQGEYGVAELAQHSELSQSAFSQHLKVLRDQGLVSVRKESQQVYYSLADQRVAAVLSALKDSFCPSEDAIV